MIPCEVVIGRGKRELVLRSPVLSAAGALGYEPSERDWEGLSLLGAFTTPVLTLHARRGAERPGLVRTTAGFLLHTGRRNPGLRRALRRHAGAWERLGVPVVVAGYASSPGELADMAAWLSGVAAVQGLEVHLPHDATPEYAADCAAEATAASDLPCLVCLPLAGAAAAAAAAAEAGADALVVAAAPLGRARGRGDEWVYGPLESPALVPLCVQAIHEVAGVATLPVVGCGGVAGAGDALEMLAAGAVAVQVGSGVYVKPGILREVYDALAGEAHRLGAGTWEAFLGDLRSAPGAPPPDAS